MTTKGKGNGKGKGRMAKGDSKGNRYDCDHDEGVDFDDWAFVMEAPIPVPFAGLQDLDWKPEPEEMAP